MRSIKKKKHAQTQRQGLTKAGGELNQNSRPTMTGSKYVSGSIKPRNKKIEKKRKEMKSYQVRIFWHIK